MNFLLLYLEFFKIGLFAVGGGLATLPFLFHLAGDRFTFIKHTGWLSSEQIGNFLAIAQCAPGAIGVNMAAQTGFLYGGTTGSIIAALGLISPAIIVITAVSKVLQAIKTNKTVELVFRGLRPAAAGLLCAAGWSAWKLTLYNSAAMAAGLAWHEILRWREGIIVIVLIFLVLKLKKHPVIYIALGAAAGVLLKL